MTSEEFINQCKKRGICTVETAKEYIKLKEKDVYTEDDIEDCYRYQERVSFLSTHRNLHSYEGCLCSKVLKNFSNGNY